MKNKLRFSWKGAVEPIIKEPKDKTLTIMIAPAGIGKSTLCEDLVQCARNRRVISSDDIRFKILDYENTGIDFDPDVEPIVWNTVKQEMRKCLRDKNVNECILDATNTSKDRRLDFIKIAREEGVVTRAIYLNESIEKARQRNKNRARQVPDEVIVRMYNELDPPTRDEFDEIYELWSEEDDG